MSFYLVTAKCGHVGKGKYYEVDFPIIAENKSQAAQICLKRGKVKKHLKNAITQVLEISKETYHLRMAEIKKNTFVRAHTKKEIISYIEEAKSLCCEKQKHKNSFETREERVFYLKKKYQIQEEYSYV